MDGFGRERSGKRVFGIIVVSVILVGAGFGLIVGTSPKVEHVSLLDVLVFHPTPTGMALFGVTSASVGLAIILGIVMALSRFDDSAA